MIVNVVENASSAAELSPEKLEQLTKEHTDLLNQQKELEKWYQQEKVSFLSTPY